MSAYRIGIYEKAFPENLSMEDMLKIAEQSGYDYFELSIDRTEQRINRLYTDSFKNAAMDAVKNQKLQIHSICLSALSTFTLGSRDAEEVKKGLDIFYQTVQFAVQIGVRIIQIPACDVRKGEYSDAETDLRFRKNLQRITEYASCFGVLVGLENMETEYMDSVQKCMRLIEEINSPYFQLYADAGNITSAMLSAGKDLICDMNYGAGHYIAFHIKETRPGKYGGLFYGEGHVDIKKTVGQAWKLGVRQFVMEYWYTGNKNWMNDLLKARELIDGILREFSGRD